MKPRHAALAAFVILGCLLFDALLVRAAVIEYDWQQARFGRWNLDAGSGDKP